MLWGSKISIVLVTSVAIPAHGSAAVETTEQTIESAYLYRLSSWSGPVRSSGARLAYDRRAREVYVVGGGRGSVGIFSDNGMQVYSFGHDSELHSVVSLAPLASGALVAISRVGNTNRVIECDYRGNVVGTWQLDDLPPRLCGKFDPVRVVSAGDSVFLVDSQAWQVVKTDSHGRFLDAYDLGLLLTLDTEKKRSNDLGGIGVDGAGNLLFTVSTLFSAYVVTPKHEVKRFGKKGGLPGQFALVSGIAADEAGNYYVTDLNRSVVMVFDSSLRFLGELGYRGRKADALVVPREVVAGNGKVFVSQGAKRGVSVFKIEFPGTQSLENGSSGDPPVDTLNRGVASTSNGRRS